MPTTLDTNMVANNIKTVFHQEPVIIPFASSITPDLSKGNIFKVTMTGDMTIANPTVVGNAFYYLYVNVDAAGGHTLSLGNNWLQLAGTFDSNALAVNILSFSTFSGVTELPLFINQRP